MRVGKVCYIGLSNTPAWAVMRAASIAEFRGWAPVIALQTEYSLLRRTVEGELFGAARELGLGVTPYSPLASGVLSGKYSRENQRPEGSGRGKLAEAFLNEHTFAVLDVLRELAGEVGASVAAVSLAWVRQRSEVISTLIGARTTAQLDANLESLAVTIPEESMSKLDELTKPDLNYPFEWLATLAAPVQQSGDRERCHHPAVQAKVLKSTT